MCVCVDFLLITLTPFHSPQKSSGLNLYSQSSVLGHLHPRGTTFTLVHLGNHKYFFGKGNNDFSKDLMVRWAILNKTNL